ncbi:hypothetical protein [Corynebacterium bovis]|uniref:hypothetical protein n=1 Tax=Corynebacterium bovis TaxID=36808 RepID=UPI000F63785C|nr:hypothetical protein [Corynebacterium bovis]MDN8579404.1 hypothetical protein [Corynebacterium bovis]
MTLVDSRHAKIHGVREGADVGVGRLPQRHSRFRFSVTGAVADGTTAAGDDRWVHRWSPAPGGPGAVDQTP